MKPETVVSWDRVGFRLFWRWRSRFRHPGRPKISGEIHQLIRRMKTDNPSWGAPRIHGELLQLGFEISEPTVSRYLRRLKRHHDEGKAKRWAVFLNNHREAIAAFDFFTVPTLTFRVLYCLFVMSTAAAVFCTSTPRRTRRASGSYSNCERRSPCPVPSGTLYWTGMPKFGSDVIEFLKASGIKPIRTSIRSPWQNGIAERWIESCRREMTDHVIPLNERHLKRLANEYLTYYHEDRTHKSLGKQTPSRRPIQSRPAAGSEILALPRIGGLHHRYCWTEAA